MTNEIIIGKEVQKGNYVVDAKYSSVSRKHAKIVRKNDGIYIEDLDSTNYTYVNGIAVKSKKVTLNDRISLGGINHYILDLEKVLKLLPLSDEEFSERFLNLKKIYVDYQHENTKLSTKGQEDMMVRRMLPTLLSGGLVSIILAFVKNPPIVISGVILSIIVFFIASKMATKSNEKMREDLNKLNEEFELNYVCPNCMNSLRGRTWKALENAGKCLICNRELKK